MEKEKKMISYGRENFTKLFLHKYLHNFFLLKQQQQQQQQKEQKIYGTQTYHFPGYFQ